nr:PREDICTED: maltase A1-like isoform X2 [Bemisia tabaci]
MGFGLFVVALTAFTCSGLAQWQAHEPQEKKWWQETVIYEIYPQSFYDSDGDGLGDLKGIEEKMDYISELGVGAVWLNPMYASPGKDNGYDVSDFRAINPKLGTMEDFESLLKTMKQNGIEMILDFVPNHTSDQHEWFKKSVQGIEPYDDYYIWRNSKGRRNGRQRPPNSWQSVFDHSPESAWEWNDERYQFYYHAFRREQPDLNFRNPLVVQEMKDILTFWMDKGVRGFRVDAAPFIFEDDELRDETGRRYARRNLPETYELVKELREHTDAYGLKNDVEIFFTTEGYASPKKTLKYYGKETRPGAHFPFNFLLLKKLKSETNAKSLNETIVDYLSSLKSHQYPNWVSGNHDWPRIPSRMGASSSVDLLNMLNLLLPGTSTVYMGDEIGMDSYWNLDKNQCPDDVGEDYRTPGRTPFHWDTSRNAGFTTAQKPWIPVNPEYYYTNVQSERQARGPSHLRNFKTMVRLKSTPAFTQGEMNSYVINKRVYAFTRKNRRIIYLIIMNLGKSFSEPFDVSEHIEGIGINNAIGVKVLSVNLGELGDKWSLISNLFSNDWNMPPKSGMVVTFRNYMTAVTVLVMNRRSRYFKRCNAKTDS